MFDRRVFIGSVIGAFFSKDFFARLETEPFQFEEVRKVPYRMLFREARSGHIIQATPIIDIEPMKDATDSVGYSFIAAPFDVKCSMDVRGALLLTEKGKLIGELPFSSTVAVCSGDQLRVNYSLSAPRETDVQTLNELVAVTLEPTLSRNGHVFAPREAFTDFLKDYRKNVRIQEK